MLHRKVMEKLRSWKNQEHKKALCILGARQIGKTTVVRYFGQQEYSCFVEVNFLQDKQAEKFLPENWISTRLLPI